MDPVGVKAAELLPENSIFEVGVLLLEIGNGSLEEVEFMRLRDGLGAIAHMQFAEDVADMPFDGVHREHKFARDFLVRSSVYNEM